MKQPVHTYRSKHSHMLPDAARRWGLITRQRSRLKRCLSIDEAFSCRIPPSPTMTT